MAIVRLNNPIVKILFCPQFEPFQPYLSLPYLKSLLKIYGIESTCYDANIDFYRWLLNGDLFPTGNNDFKKSFIKEKINEAVDVLIYGTNNIIQYRWSINIIEEYLYYVSPKDIKISLSGLEIKNKYSSDDLKSVVYSDDNIFNKYFFTYKKEILGKPETNYYFFSLVILDQLAASLSIARQIKVLKPNAKIVFGGAMVSRFYKRLLDVIWINEIIDFIEPGEGYKIISKIFTINNEYSGHVSPDFSDLELKKYLSPSIVLPYMIAHGCLWGKCLFCSHHLSYEGFRPSKISEVIIDLIKLKKEYNIEFISFCDEHLSNAQLDEFSDKINEIGLNIKWSTFVRAESRFIAHKFTKKLYQAGGRLLFFGFETVSQRLLNLMKKGNNSSNYLPILKSCKEANISVRLDMMFGFPTETDKEAAQTLKFIRNNKDLIDTPFSSVPVSVFELRENIPVFNDLDRFALKVDSLKRGDLDEQYDFTYTDGTDYSSKVKWRNEMINFMKNEMDAEISCPYNKTHQLIFKALYDVGRVSLPISDIAFKFPSKYECKFISGIYIYEENDKLFIDNIPTGSQITITKELKEVINDISNGIILDKLFKSNCEKIEQSILIKLLRFFIRNDYIIINEINKTEVISE